MRTWMPYLSSKSYKSETFMCPLSWARGYPNFLNLSVSFEQVQEIFLGGLKVDISDI